MLDQGLNYHRVADYIAGLQAVQGLESRGDFQFKGIHRLFMVVSEWTDKYAVNKILPNAEQLAREVGLDRVQLENYLNELCFKSFPPLAKKLTSIEFDPSAKSKSETIYNMLFRNSVFCRPANVDAGSAQRYINGCNETSAIAIKKCFKDNRIPYTGEKFREFIFTKINANKLSETYASYDIGILYNCPYDIKKELKDSTINIHLKPVLKKLVDDKVLLFFRNDKAIKSANKSIFLYNNRDELIERVDIYVAYLKKNIIPVLQKIGVLGEIHDDEYKNFVSIATSILKFLDDSYGDQKTMIEEIIILSNYYDSFKEEIEKKKFKEQVDEVIKAVQSAGKMVDLATVRLNGQPLLPDLIPYVTSNENLLYVEYNDGRSLFEFVLHRSNIKLAIDLAKKVYNVTGNDTDIRILQRMNVMNILDPDSKKEFTNVEMESLFKYLPLLVRLWRSMFGSAYVTQEEAAMIRQKNDTEQKKRIMDSKMKQIQKEKTKLAEERMKHKPTESTSSSLNEKASSQNVQKSQAMTEEDISMDSSSPSTPGLMTETEARETMKRIMQILDSAWDLKVMPDREYLLKELGNMSEDQLVIFLKKYSQKDIYSFQIKSKLEKFKWPILITKTYLRRNGNRLADFAQKEADEQRKTLMPNQEKYDLYTSLEDFLDKVLPKL